MLHIHELCKHVISSGNQWLAAESRAKITFLGQKVLKLVAR